MRRIVTGWILVLCMVAPLVAAEVDPALEDAMRATPEDLFSVIVKLHNPYDIRALDQALHQRRTPLAERHAEVIAALQANAAQTQPPVIERLETWQTAKRVNGYTAYWIENLIVIHGRGEAILELAADPAVESIGANFRAKLIDPVRGPIRRGGGQPLDEQTTPGQNAVGATRVNRELGITGQGTLVAGVDTGVQGSHPALATKWRGYNGAHPVAECWLDLIGGRPNPTDNNGHGTHTMGTMCGREIRPNDTITVGSAPNAQWIATNPIDQGVGQPFQQDIFAAFQWLADPDGNPNTMDDVPDVVQNSWGVTTGHVGTPCFDNWNTVIQNCEATGAVIVWSAGNEGGSGLRSPAKYELTPVQIFSVGAVDATNFPAPYPLASFSSRGPSNCPPNPTAIKPEISAPGVDVRSSVPGGGYEQTNWSGTSMAGPHVSGVVALMREACPDCDPQTIKEAIMATAIDAGYGPVGEDNSFGAGFLNAYDAVLMVASLGRVDGFVTDGTGNPLQGARVQAIGLPNFVLSNAQGYYNLSAQEGTYSVMYSKFGYQSVIMDNVQTNEGDTTHVNVTLPTAAAGVLSGVVRVQSGIPVQGARVAIGNTPLDTLTTNADGRFVQALPATTYPLHVRFTINLTPPRMITADTLITVNAGDTTFAQITVFVDIVEPTAPDAYGYRCYDRYDRDLPAPYTWVELDSSLGYPGRAFAFEHHDSSVFFPAPFPLKFYGQEHNLLTVSINGWMLPGEHHYRGHTNTRIPYAGPLDPPGIIAPFWDDLRNGLGEQQFYWHDSAGGRWIFEFIDQRRVGGSNHFSNWQVHFLDPAFYPTMTGDCQINFIYGRMDYIGSCTIGIEHPVQTTGLQIVLDGALNAASWPIEDGAALRFTTAHPTQTGTVNGTLTLYPPLADHSSARLRVAGRVITPAANGQFSDNSVPACTAAVALVLPGYEQWRGSGFAVTPSTPRTIPVEAWRLDPPQDAQHFQFDGAVTLLWRRPLSVELRANPAVRYSVYRDGIRIASAIADTFFTDTPQPDGAVVSYTVRTHYRYGTSLPTEPYEVEIDLGTDDALTGVPAKFELYPNYPNPFNPSTRIRLDVPASVASRLEIFDVTGRLVRTLQTGTLAAGRYEFSWDGRNGNGQAAASGLYLCRFASDRFTAAQKMLLVK